MADSSIESLGAVDLSNCDREQIHYIGGIQPSGFLIALSADWRVTHLSANTPDYLKRPLDTLLGASLLEVVGPQVVHTIRNGLPLLRDPDAVERAYAVPLLGADALFDLTMHRSGPAILIEAEPSRPPNALSTGAMIRSMLARIHGRAELLKDAARLVQALTGFDRVMIYRFHADGSGEVVAERTRTGVESFLGLRYPAEDIPRQARALLIRNPLRLLADASAEPSPILSEQGAAAQPLDLSMSVLRAHSTMCIEYLSNMGVGATMTVSLLREGKLWGLISCHHMGPRHVGAELRIATELFGQILSLFIEKQERAELSRYELRTREIHNQLVETVVETGSLGEDITDLAERMTELVPSDGIGVYVRGKMTLKGATPTQEEFRGLLDFLNAAGTTKTLATVQLSHDYAPANAFVDRAAGMLAIPLSRSPRDYVVFFRRELTGSVTWAGKPGKLLASGPNGPRLTPRKSFEAWLDTVRGQSAEWTEAQLLAAEALRVTLLEVVLQLAATTEREGWAAAEKQELLVSELNHRVRNILGLIRGLIAQSRLSAVDVDTFATVLGDRVHALARAHDQITARNWEPSSLATLLATEASAYSGLDTVRISAQGPAVLLQPQAFSAVALVVHELIINAAKYGALSGPQGQVAIQWAVDGVGDLSLDWTESGGPSVQPPTRRGFGMTIIERSIPHELGGQATLDYAASGMRARFSLPAQHVVALAGEAAIIDIKQVTSDAPSSQPARLTGVVLLVEDSIIIALEAEDMLLALGASRVDIASNVPDALQLIEAEAPSFALLDINLGPEMSWPVAARLQELGVPLLFATGYGAAIDYPLKHRTAPTVTKPYTSDSLAQGVGLAFT